MPSEEFTQSTTWTAPFAVIRVDYQITAGGGGGYRDNEGEGTNGRGGGGGSGGYNTGTLSVTPGAQYGVTVGGGGAVGQFSPGGNGGDSGFGSIIATGGGAGQDRAGGAGGSPNGNAGSGDGSQQHPGDGSGGVSSDSPYGNGGNGNRNGKDNASAGNAGRVRIQYVYEYPSILSFSASPQTQTSGNDGIPDYSTELSWSTNYASSLTLTSSAGESWDVTGSTGQSISNLPQSTGSCATRTYTLTANNASGVPTSASITVTACNDNTPSNSWDTVFTNLEPSTLIAKKLGTLSGIDMVTAVSSPNNGVFFANGSGGSYSNPQYFTNGQQVWIRMVSLPFNTDVSGETGDFGKTNTKTVSVTAGGNSAFNVSYVTRKPRISEDFDYDGAVGQYPYEDIDLISNSPTSTLVTQTLNMDDIEIDMPIATDDPNVQIKINNGSWQNIQEI